MTQGEMNSPKLQKWAKEKAKGWEKGGSILRLQ